MLSPYLLITSVDLNYSLIKNSSAGLFCYSFMDAYLLQLGKALCIDVTCVPLCSTNTYYWTEIQIKSHLLQIYHVDLRKAAWFSAVPWSVMAFAGYFAGLWSDMLIRGGMSVTLTRKIMQVLYCSVISVD